MNAPLSCSGMARILKRSQFYLHTPRSSANRMNHTYVCLLSWSWSSFTNPVRIEGLGWLVRYGKNVRHRELNPDTVSHLSTNRARPRLTSLIEANALTTTPDHQLECALVLIGDSALQQSLLYCAVLYNVQWIACSLPLQSLTVKELLCGPSC